MRAFQYRRPVSEGGPETILLSTSNASELNFNFQNVIDGEAIGIAITGMLIVFAALALISLFIATLPRIPGIAVEAAAPDAPPAGISRAAAAAESEIVAAIAFVMHHRKQDQRPGTGEAESRH